MIRREAIVGLLGVLAAPIAGLFGKVSEESPVASQWRSLLRSNCRQVFKKTSDGLFLISWDGIQAGDDIVLFDWVDGYIVGIMNMGLVLRGPEKSLPNDPVAFDKTRYTSIECVKS